MTDTTKLAEAIKEAATEPSISTTMLVIVAILAAFAHTAKKIKRLQDKAEDANIPFYPGHYIQKEWLTIASSLACIAIAALANEEIASIHVAGVLAGKYLIIVFAAIGWMSDSIMDWVFGGYEAMIKKEVKKRQSL